MYLCENAPINYLILSPVNFTGKKLSWFKVFTIRFLFTKLPLGGNGMGMTHILNNVKCLKHPAENEQMVRRTWGIRI